jgi:hypothetical protein
MFKPGDRVAKTQGNYRAHGTVLGSGITTQGKILVMFEFDAIPGMVHIFGEAQLEHLDPAVKRAYRRGAQPE